MPFSIQFECNDKDAAPNFILIDTDRCEFIIDKNSSKAFQRQANSSVRNIHRPKL
jgi:hypothetical protein